MNETRKEFVAKYLSEIHSTLEQLEPILIEKMVKISEILTEARDEGRFIFIMGNGGSAATSSHMVCDLIKGVRSKKHPRFKAMALSDNVPTMMAYSNDESYDDIFIEQLKNFMGPKDVVLGISGSGNSENVIRAIKWANENDAITIGWTGFDGGRLEKEAQLCITVPSNSMQQIEDIHMIFEHLLASMLMAEMEL